jgi:NNP family nitrate/nitrite transporter-like MFS transporter
VGVYTVGIILSASVLRIAGGWMADRVGGLRLLRWLAAAILGLTVAAATLPADPWVMVLILVACFAAMGAGNGAVFQLVPLRFKSTTAVAGSLIGEIGALAGGFLPNAMGIGKQTVGSFAPGFLAGTVLTVLVLIALKLVARQWTTTWVGAGGRALEEPAAETHARRGSTHLRQAT